MQDSKKQILVIFGGCSPEYSVSLSSASAVIKNINREDYGVLLMGISQEGKTYLYEGDVEDIEPDRWQNEKNCTRAMISQNRGEGALVVFRETGVESLGVDLAFPVLHGQNGEDGTIQGLLELAGIKIIGCGTLSSALCMDKVRSHKLVSLEGITVPKGIVIESLSELETAESFALELGYPVIVKPIKAGSSYGVSKVKEEEKLRAAIEYAFKFDKRVMIEEFIDGFEVGCAVMGLSAPETGEVDEIEISGDFFDFFEKYNLVNSKIHVPARVSREKSDEIKEAAKKIYLALDCSGFARVDLFVRKNGEVVFNETNTIPGFTSHSRYPMMMRARGLEFNELVARLIREAIEED